MKTILIIYPHWYPANLAGVHRPRLIGNFLNHFDWKVRVLTVKANHFEEAPDKDFKSTFSSNFEVSRVNAFPISKPRLIGDIGIRAFFQLYKKGKEIIRQEKPDFLWIPIPSFYTSLLGRLLHDKTGIRYGIDYIDPWVRDLTNQKSIKAHLSQLVARRFEPFAIKKASLISGVSLPYYQDVIKRNFPKIGSQLGSTSLTTSPRQPVPRNPHTNLPFTDVAMPYGFDPNDHAVKVENIQFPWKNKKERKIWLYAGAFLPNSHLILQAFFESIKNLRKVNKWDEETDLWFIGTGNYPSKTIEAYAKDFNLTDIVTEHRRRYPFLHVLNFLAEVDTVMIIGSTEKHYTASKTFQALLSQRPVVAAFHIESSAIQVMAETKADNFTVGYKPNMTHLQLVESFEEVLLNRLNKPNWQPDLSALDQYSAEKSAKQLAAAIERIL